MDLNEQYLALARFLYGLADIGVRVAQCCFGVAVCIAQGFIAIGGPIVAVIVIADWIVGPARSVRWNFTRASLVLSVLLFACGLLWFADHQQFCHVLMSFGAMIPPEWDCAFVIAWGISSVLLIAATIRQLFPKPQLRSVRGLSLIHVAIAVLFLLSMYGRTLHYELNSSGTPAPNTTPSGNSSSSENSSEYSHCAVF